jgi:hypothetical protein
MSAAMTKKTMATIFSEAIISAIVSGVFVSLILGYFITTRDQKIKSQIEEEFKKRDSFFATSLHFKSRCVDELLGPVNMQLKRSAIALEAYKPNNPYRENILKECNETIRNLLLTKSALIPIELMPHAADLIRHYDEWLESYNQIRVLAKDTKTAFVFTYNFPQEAETQFIKVYDEYRTELNMDGKLK